MAVSSRNPLHILAGNNDYRTVDLPGVASSEPTGDAWLGLFSSFDGGSTWQSVLVPGYPQDTSGTPSPLKGYDAGADPMVRAGTNGLFYYSGLVFNREANGTSAVFVARYVDDNNFQGANTIRYLSTSIVATGDATHFIDKPVIAVDIPRSGSPTCTIPAGDNAKAATISAGRIYVAYTQFNGPESSNQSAIMFSESSDCGNTWSTPQKVSGTAQTNQGVSLAIDPHSGNVYAAWRIFAVRGTTQVDAIAGAGLPYGATTFTPIIQRSITPFDQGTSNVSFRTNAYPSMTVDNSGIVYVAWAQRGLASNAITGGDARIQVLGVKPALGGSNQIKSVQIAGPVTVDNYQGRGHQIMPAVAFSSGKLTVAWYDFRDDDRIAIYTPTGGGNYTSAEELPSGVSPVFSTYVADPSASSTNTNVWRHTVDIRAAQASSGLPASFRPSVMVSQYSYGTPEIPPSDFPPSPDAIEQLEFDAPNLPIFQLGSAPFMGDYIDVAGPTFIPYKSGATELWRYNNLSGDPDYTEVVWTDNRNVIQPADGNWANYTPVGSTGGSPSLFDPSQTRPACSVGQTGIRNQDIYTASLSPGIIMGSKGNSKQLTTSFPREFPVTIQNPTAQTVYYRLTIGSQPTGGSASFLQYPVSGLPNPMTQIYVAIPPFSSASRSVFIKSSNPSATVPVTAVQTGPNNNVIAGGLTSSITLNSDVSNPSIANPGITNVELYNPSIANPSIANPSIANPSIANPSIANPSIANPSIANPSIANPSIANPSIANPSIANPSIANPSIANTALSGAITDVNYPVSNSGNTATTYAVNLVQNQPPPSGITFQLIVSGVYLTPIANACTLTVEAHYIPIANVPNPTFIAPGSVLPNGPPAAGAPTFALQPGEQAIITLRIYVPSGSSLQNYNPVTAISPVVGSQAINTNLPPPPPTLSVLSIVTSALPPVALNGAYNVQLQAAGGSGAYAWTPQGSLAPGITLSQNGVLSGSPTAVGTYTVPIQVSDQSGQTAQVSLTLVVAAAAAITINPITLPAGQFNSPYPSTSLSATGGTAPYAWSMNEGGVLPVGMSLSNSGVLSGAPAQAGLWTVPVTVTDSSNPPLSQTASLPLSIGLATGYANTPNCDMPYPATPLYLANALSWTVDTSSLPNPGQMFVLPSGNALSGCLTGGGGLNAFPSGNYQLSLTASTANGPLTFPMTLSVVGQDTRSNGTFTANSGGVGNLPPGGYQQGVVTPAHTLTYSPGLWGPSFAGNFLFGFSGGSPQFCTAGTHTTGQISLSVPQQPGRYDILFDGTNQTCQQATAFPTSPAPLTIDSVDAIANPVTFAGTTLSAVSLTNSNGSNPTGTTDVLTIVQQSTGSTIPVTVTFNYAFDPTPGKDGCTGPSCDIFTLIGLNTDSAPQACGPEGQPGGAGNGATVTVQAPNQPGRYYVGMDRALVTGCSSSWWDGPPSASRYIGIVDVLTPPPSTN